MKNEENNNPTQGRKILRFLAAWVIFFTLGAFSVNAQEQTVKGTVTDMQGEPLIGVSIEVKGASMGVVSDVDGQFSINVNKGGTLVFKHIGFTTKEVKVSGTPVNVKLEENVVALNEVVVSVGYGTQKRGDVTGAISSVDAKSLEQRQPVNAMQALQGQAAGVQITASSGAPGASSNVVIRGPSSFGDVSPLYVVDGIIMDNIDMINPNDILSMDIMKDAASNAIYGTRATGGVIVVTTKKGSDGKPRIDVRYINSYGYLANKLPQMNRLERDIFVNTVQSGRVLTQGFQITRTVTDSTNLQGRTSNDYQDIISQTAVRNDLNVSIAGGSKNLNVYTSLGYLSDKGIILTSYADRYTGRSKVEYQATDFLKFTTNISAGFQKNNNINEGQTFYNAIRRPTESMLYFPDGTLVDAGNSNPSGKRNPLIELNERVNETRKYSGTIYQSGELKFLKYFSLIGAATANLWYSVNHQYASPLTNTSAASIANGEDSGSDETRFFTDILLESYLNYTQTFNKVHNVSVVAGVSREEDNTTIRHTDDKNYLLKFPEMQVAQGASLSTVTTRYGYLGEIGSYFGRLSYDYKGRYIFRSNVRRDGSSSFGKKNRWGLFPSASFAWRLSDEFFMDWTRTVLSDAKIRASWGVNGNDKVGSGIGGYAARNFYTPNTSTAAYSGLLSVYPNPAKGNDYLKWEQTKQTDVGIDLTFLGGKFVFTGDWYLKRTVDLFNNFVPSSESGYSGMMTNVGTVDNKGIELSIMAVPVRTRDFTWNTSINWTKNRNTIVYLYGGDYIFSSTYAVMEGKPSGLFYGYKFQGVYAYDVSNAYTSDYKTRLTPVFARDDKGNVIFNNQKKPQLTGYQYPNGTDYGWKSDGSGNPVYQLKDKSGNAFAGGDNIWEDHDGSGTIDESDRYALACAQPDWYGGWNNQLRYKDFTLNFSFYASWGGTIYNQLLYNLSNYGDNTSNSDPRAVVQGWRYQGDITQWNIPGQTASVHTSADNNRLLNSRYLEDASYIRLQTMRLAYQLPPLWTKKLLMQSMQVYVYGNGLATWTKYRGYDPEIVSGGILNPGTDTQLYPKKREIGFGISITL
jgi:TonB-linked SusC/RagA family outer membrane protein